MGRTSILNVPSIGDHVMQTVRDLLARKPAKIVMIDPRCTIFQALLKLDEHGIGVLIVADQEGNLAGIVSERDIARGAARFGENFLRRPVSELMVRDLITCEVMDHVADALAMMNGARVRHLPVIDGTEIVGIVSIRDMMSVCADAMRSGYDEKQRQELINVLTQDQSAPESWLTS